jgi:hypothetical protein
MILGGVVMNINKWLAIFGESVDEELINKHVTSDGNYLWHIFTWGEVTSLKGDEAKNAFNALEYTEAIKFYGGYSNQINNVSVVLKLSASAIDNDPASDVYIVATDYSWTYVRTHEDGLGPYLCIKK